MIPIWHTACYLTIGAAIALSLDGCAPLDPMLRAGEWHPSGANEANLEAMVVNPHDLVRGNAAGVTDGQQAAVAVARLRQGNVKPLPDSGLAEIRVQGAPGSATAAATTGGGN